MTGSRIRRFVTQGRVSIAVEVREIAASLAARARAGELSGRGGALPLSRPFGEWSYGPERDQVGGGGGDQQPLGEPAPAPLAGGLDQTVRLERAQVVVDLLARQPHALGQRRRGGGLVQLAQQPRPDGVGRDDAAAGGRLCEKTK